MKAICLYGLMALGLLFAACGRVNKPDALGTNPDTTKTISLLTTSEKLCPADIRKSTDYAYMALKEAEKAGYQKGIARARFQLSVIDYYKGDYKGSLTQIKQGYEIYSELKDSSQIAMCLNLMGVMNYMLLNHTEALKYYHQSAEINKNIQAYRQLSLNLQNMGNIYLSLLDYSNAELQYRQGLKLCIEYKLTKNIISFYQNLGTYFGDIKKYDSALYYYEKVVASIQKPESNPYIYTGVMNNIGHLYRNQKDYDKARSYLQRSLDLSIKFKFKENQIESMKQLAEVEYSTGNYLSARKYSETVINLSRETGLKEPIDQAYEIIYKTYKKENNTLLALAYYEKMQEIKDSIRTLKNSEEIRKLDAKYQSERLNKENQLLQEQNNAYKAKQRAFFLVLALLVVLAIFTIIVFYLRNLTTKQKNLLIIREKQILENEKQMIETMLKQKQNELLAISTLQVRTNQSLNQIIIRIRQIVNLEMTNSPPGKELIKISDSIEHLAKADAWEDFRNRFIEIHPHFFENLNLICPTLTNNDLKIASLIRMNLNTKEIAAITMKSLESIHIARYRLRKKLGTEDDKLMNFLLSVPGSQ
jgi:tetratricopeptide (TPR) repeat protein